MRNSHILLQQRGATYITDVGLYTCACEPTYFAQTETKGPSIVVMMPHMDEAFNKPAESTSNGKQPVRAFMNACPFCVGTELFCVRW